METMEEISFWKKSSLTIDEAAAYYGIRKNKLLRLTGKETSQFVLLIGVRRLIKRCKFKL